MRAATAERVEPFDKRAYYSITTTVDGQEVALTFILPTDVRPRMLTASPGKSKVVLQPFTKKATQLWQPHFVKMDPGDAYLIYAKITDLDDAPSGIIEVSNPDGEFSEAPAYREKHNRLTVGLSSGEGLEHWIINSPVVRSAS